MSVGMTTFHDLTWRYTSGSYGQRWSLDQDFVKTYLNLDGSRHTATGEEFTTEVENRDYRLSQSIITPGYTKLVGGVSTATPPDFTVTLTGYQVIKFNIDDKAYESAIGFLQLAAHHALRRGAAQLRRGKGRTRANSATTSGTRPSSRCVSAQASTASARRRQTPICNSTTG